MFIFKNLLIITGFIFFSVLCVESSFAKPKKAKVKSTAQNQEEARLRKVMDEVFKLKKSAIKGCSGEELFANVDKSYLKAFQNRCLNPIAFVCDPKVNPYLKFVSEYKNRRDELNLLIASQTSFVDNVAAQSYLEDIYTEERKIRAQEIFNKAKQKYIAFLKNELELAKFKKNSTKLIKHLTEMISAVEAIQLYFGSSDSSHYTFDFNVSFARRSPPKSFMISLTEPTVYLELEILTVDTMPEALEFAFMHEFTHAIDLSSFEKEGSGIDHPYYSELECLSKPETARARKSDLACFERNLEKLKNTVDEDIYLNFVEKLRKAPDQRSDVKLKLISGIPLEECPGSQIDEAFSDYLATETFFYTEQTDSKGDRLTVLRELSQNGISTARSSEKIADLARSKSLDRLFQVLAVYCDAGKTYDEVKEEEVSGIKYIDGHLLREDVINGVILANPQARAAMLCFGDEPKPKSLGSDTPVQRQYCSRQHSFGHSE